MSEDEAPKRRRKNTATNEETAGNPALAQQQDAEPERQAKVDGQPDVDSAAGDSNEGQWSGAAEKGPLSPAQYDDDGWGDTPVQMRDLPRADTGQQDRQDGNRDEQK